MIEPDPDRPWQIPAIDELFVAAGLRAPDPDSIVLGDAEDAGLLCDDVLGTRERAVVGVAPRTDDFAPVLAPADVRAVVGPGVRVYLIPDEYVLEEVQARLGPRLRIPRGSARIWWPGATAYSDPAAHPWVIATAGERRWDTLEAFAEQFDLSRPRVRREIALAEDLRGVLEREIIHVEERESRLHERLRDAQLECHCLRTRAEVAEQRLARALRGDRSD
jgi:hypothetical protein